MCICDHNNTSKQSIQHNYRFHALNPNQRQKAASKLSKNTKKNTYRSNVFIKCWKGRRLYDNVEIRSNDSMQRTLVSDWQLWLHRATLHTHSTTYIIFRLHPWRYINLVLLLLCTHLNDTDIKLSLARLRLQPVLTVVMGRRQLNIYFSPVHNGQQNANGTLVTPLTSKMSSRTVTIWWNSSSLRGISPPHIGTGLMGSSWQQQQ